MLHSGRSGISRRTLLQAGATVSASASVFSPAILSAQVPTIRYATGGAIAPNEIETLFFTDFFKKNVLKRYGKEYNLEVTFTRGTPEAASLMAAEQVDFAHQNQSQSAISRVIRSRRDDTSTLQDQDILTLRLHI